MRALLKIGRPKGRVFVGQRLTMPGLDYYYIVKEVIGNNYMRIDCFYQDGRAGFKNSAYSIGGFMTEDGTILTSTEFTP